MARQNVKSIVNGIVDEKGEVSSQEITRATGLTRQAVHRHLRSLVRSGALVPEGRGRATRYRRPGGPAVRRHTFPRAGLSESEVYSQLEAELVPPAASVQAKSILHYAFTELLNNAIDHSDSPDVEVLVETSADRACFAIIDRGIGIFRRVQLSHRLDSELIALQELSKGKLTSQPARHSGEGIFFVSKAVDRLEIESGAFRWIIDNRIPDQALAQTANRQGTRVRVVVSASTTRSLQEIFERYTDNFAFTKTRAVVKLFEHGTEFVSRSEAKRLLHSMERFEEIILDFQGVAGIGQGFADEIFRVWSREHPAIALIPVNMNPAVEFMVRRGLAT